MEGKHLSNFIKNYGVLIGFIIQLVVTWTILKTSVADHEKRIITLEKYRSDQTLLLTDIQSRLASIETSILFIKDRLR